MNRKFIVLPAIFALFFACGTKNSPDVAASASKNNGGSNYLSMKINGVEWKADHDISGAFHPKGYNKLIMIAGAKGPKSAGEQTFNINIYNTEGPGIFQFKDGNTDLSVAQLANLTPDKFLYGSMMGFDMKVVVKTATTKPDVVDATFEGTMTSNAGDVIKITEGKFYYHE